MEREKPQGAPDRAEISRQTIYTERPSRSASSARLTSAVRRYDRFSLKDPGSDRVYNPPLFKGVTVWIKRQAALKPQVLSLTADRPLRKFEFSGLTKQVIVPQLVALLPRMPMRVGDSWSIERPVARFLVSELPDEADYELTGKLVEVRKAASGPGLTAIIGVSGQMNLSTRPQFAASPASFSIRSIARDRAGCWIGHGRRG